MCSLSSNLFRLNPLSTPPANSATHADPLGHLCSYLAQFPYRGTKSAITQFMPLNPKDIVGGRKACNQMWVAWMCSGHDGAGWQGTYRNFSIFSGNNYSVTNDTDAKYEYGPGWTYDESAKACLYRQPPFDSPQLHPTEVNRELLIKALTVILGPYNPAFAQTDGWVMIDHRNAPTLGAGLWTFDQVRTQLDLPRSYENEKIHSYSPCDHEMVYHENPFL